MTLSEQLDEIQQRYEFRDETLISKIGISLPELESFRRNSKDENIIHLVQQFVDRLSMKVYPTVLLNEMEKLLKSTHKENAITVIGAVSGAGKTFAADMFCSKVPEAIYIYVPELITVRFLVNIISQRLGLPYEGLNLWQQFEQIKMSVKRNRALFVFDEADRLTRKMYEVLRDLWLDGKGNCGIAFVGDENLMNKIKRGQSLRENLIRLLRRVKYNEIFQPIYEDDVRMIFKDAFVKHVISNPAIKRVFELFKELGGLGSILQVVDYLEKFSARSGDKPNDDMVREALKRMKLKF